VSGQTGATPRITEFRLRDAEHLPAQAQSATNVPVNKIWPDPLGAPFAGNHYGMTS
jgi:hypothetical protein